MRIKLKVGFFKKKNKTPVLDFLDKLEKRDKKKILMHLDGIEECGLRYSKVQFRQIKNKLWEIKIKTSSGGIRIFYVIVRSEEIILLHAYKKKTQKAPKKEIEKALTRMREFLKENN